MRFENTRTARPRQFAHRAAYYSSSEDLLAVIEPITRDALRQNRPVAVIGTAYTERRLRGVLGDEAAGLIHLPPPPPWLASSGQAVISEYARKLREVADWAGPVTVIAEHHPHRPGISPSAWIEADAALNVALATLPVTITCLYPTDLATETVSATVRWNHSHLVSPDGTVHENPEFRSPAEVLAMYPVAAPTRLGIPDLELTFTPWQLTELRTAVSEAASALGLPIEKAQDFVLAVNEVASNAVEHGYGVGQLQLWRQAERLVCEVHDKGTLREPLPGLRPPHPSSARGRGIWIARQLCDLLHVWTDPHGTHVRLHISRT